MQSTKKKLEQRRLAEANFIIATQATVRATAKAFRVSKTTVHKDVTERLLKINLHLAAEVREVLVKNKEERHIRGGEATKRRYLNAKRKN